MKYPFLLLTFFLFLGCSYKEVKYHVYYHGNGSTDGCPPRDYSSNDVWERY